MARYLLRRWKATPADIPSTSPQATPVTIKGGHKAITDIVTATPAITRIATAAIAITFQLALRKVRKREEVGEWGTAAASGITELW